MNTLPLDNFVPTIMSTDELVWVVSTPTHAGSQLPVDRMNVNIGDPVRLLQNITQRCEAVAVNIPRLGPDGGTASDYASYVDRQCIAQRFAAGDRVVVASNTEEHAGEFGTVLRADLAEATLTLDSGIPWTVSTGLITKVSRSDITNLTDNEVVTLLLDTYIAFCEYHEGFDNEALRVLRNTGKIDDLADQFSQVALRPHTVNEPHQQMGSVMYLRNGRYRSAVVPVTKSCGCIEPSVAVHSLAEMYGNTPDSYKVAPVICVEHRN